jgi:hypothetical protein
MGILSTIPSTCMKCLTRGFSYFAIVLYNHKTTTAPTRVLGALPHTCARARDGSK